VKESTRIYSRSVSSALLAGLSVASYYRLGESFWLAMSLFTAVSAVFWFMRARSAGDALAPPLVNPQLVKRLAVICGVAGGALLVTMLWRVNGDWVRLIEQENLWLAMGWILLLSIAAFLPIEWRQARSR